MSRSGQDRTRGLRLALLGHPVEHSRSAQLFEAQAARGGVPVDYELIDTPASQLHPTLERLRAGVWDGVNITVPHKAMAAHACDRLDAVAKASGAVNVVRREPDGSLSGFNTDAAGFLDALASHGPRAHAALRSGASVLMVGDGGAARGICSALAAFGVQIMVLSRLPARAATQFVPGLAARCCDYGDPAVVAHLATTVLIVQATSLGMQPNLDASPLLPWSSVNQQHCVVDLIYSPWFTRFMEHAHERGAFTLNGWPMLVHQAARALEIWAGPGTGPRLIAAAEALEARSPSL